MSEHDRPRPGGTVKAWLALLASAVALALSAARCDKDVTVGVDPSSDAAGVDGAGADGGLD